MDLESYLRWVNKARPGRFVWMSSILGAPYNLLGKAIAPPPADTADGPEVIIIPQERKFAEEERNAKPR